MNRNLYELFGAETLQHRDDEQAQADGWAVLWALGFAFFGAGVVFGCVICGLTTAVALAWRMV